jgi:uncharacterized protein (DUF2384 family)
MLLTMTAVWRCPIMVTRGEYPERAEVLLDAALPSVNAIKEHLGMTTDELAAATDRSLRSTARWLGAEETTPVHGPAARCVRRLAHLDYLLEDVLGSGSGRDWLRAPNPGFRGRAPIDLITDGRADEVVAALELLADGAPL